MSISIDDCAKDGGFIFHAKDDGKKFLINRLRHSVAVVTQISSCSDKILNDTSKFTALVNGHRNRSCSFSLPGLRLSLVLDGFSTIFQTGERLQGTARQPAFFKFIG